MTFHHIGVACENIESTAGQYLGLGYSKSDVTTDPLQNVNICFLYHESMPCVELLSPVDETSPVVEILKKNGTTPYHICYSVENLDEAVKALRKDRFVVVSKAKPAKAIEGCRVAFLFHKDVGLIELVGE